MNFSRFFGSWLKALECVKGRVPEPDFGVFCTALENSAHFLEHTNRLEMLKI